ncbi:hypothetical protein DFH29DRAFT_207194 [Suillus ampliporus]|nr:hypothetical protein DFH29DRAFT_207194 [Suillus ampliporus]
MYRRIHSADSLNTSSRIKFWPVEQFLFCQAVRSADHAVLVEHSRWRRSVVRCCSINLPPSSDPLALEVSMAVLWLPNQRDPCIVYMSPHCTSEPVALVVTQCSDSLQQCGDATKCSELNHLHTSLGVRLPHVPLRFCYMWLFPSLLISIPR